MIDFNICDFISGPLMDHFRGRLNIEFYSNIIGKGPAEVEISQRKDTILLRIDRDTWKKANKGGSYERRVLAHEVGHVWLHQNDTFNFSNDIDTNHKFIPSENFVEDQANVFADIFLLPDAPILSFTSKQDLIDYCDLYSGVPIEVISRRFDIAQTVKRNYFSPRYESGILCSKCGEEKIFVLLSFRKCENCGHISY